MDNSYQDLGSIIDLTYEYREVLAVLKQKILVDEDYHLILR
jgi:hypothetical protein